MSDGSPRPYLIETLYVISGPEGPVLDEDGELVTWPSWHEALVAAADRPGHRAETRSRSHYHDEV